MAKRFDLSARGQTRVVLWTALGTVGCVLAALGFDAANLSSLDASQRYHAILTDIFAPIALAMPLLYIFSSKLRELAIAHHKLAVLASTDSLTSILNRGAFSTLVDAYLEQVRDNRRQESGALMVIDVDHFKKVNDTLGHGMGDEALKLVAQTIRSTVRSVDLVGRMGGEEFGVFLPATNMRRAEAAAERIRQAVGRAEFDVGGGTRHITVSVGCAAFSRPVTFAELYQRADEMLYRAKDSGRNRVAFSAMDLQLAA